MLASSAYLLLPAQVTLHLSRLMGLLQVMGFRFEVRCVVVRYILVWLVFLADLRTLSTFVMVVC